MERRKLQWYALTLCLLFLLTGCTRQAPTSPPMEETPEPAATQNEPITPAPEASPADNTTEPLPPKEAEPPVPEATFEPEKTLKIVLPRMTTSYLDKAMADYMQLHPEVLVECKYVEEYDIKTQLLAGVDSIDIFGMESLSAEQYAYYRAGVMLPLQDQSGIQAVLQDPRLIPGVLDAFIMEDNLIALPLEYRVRAMRIREDHLAVAQLSQPEPDWDWFDFFSMMEHATDDVDADGVQDGLPLIPYANHTFTSVYWPIFLEDYIVNNYHEETKSIDFDTPLFRQLMEQWQEYCKIPWTTVAYDPTRHTWGAMQLADIGIGQGTTWVIGGEDYTRETFPYQIIPQPRLPEQEYYAIGGESCALAVYSRSHNPTLAADFLAFLCSYEEKHKYDLWYDQAILYQIQNRDDYTHLPEGEDTMADEETALFLERTMESYMKVAAKSRVSCISGDNQRLLVLTILDPYMKGNLTLDEMIIMLTEKTDMMLR